MSARLLFVVTLLSCFARPAHAETYWLWAIDGRWTPSKSPCADERRPNPARRAVLEFIGSETYVSDDGGQLALVRGKAIDPPKKQVEGPSGELIGFWYAGLRTWIVTLYPRESPAFVSVTLVMERDRKRVGKPICHERWIAPVSP